MISLQQPILTQAGIDAATTAITADEKVIISHIAVGNGTGIDSHNADGSAATATLAITALQNEMVRVPIDQIMSGEFENNFVIMAKIPPHDPAFTVSEVGIFLSDGTLFAYTASTSHALGTISALVGWEYGGAFKITQLPSGSVTLELIHGDGNFTTSIMDQIAQTMTAGIAAVGIPSNVAPIGDVTDMPVTGLSLVATAFQSTKGFGFEATQWVIVDDGDTILYDSGITGAASTHSVPDDVLQPSTHYRWQVRFLGRLAGETTWSSYSSLSGFTTGAFDASPIFETYSQTFTSSSSWTAPAGCEAIDVLTGQGGDEKPDRIGSTNNHLLVRVDAGYTGGSAAPKAHATALKNALLGLSTGSYNSISLSTKIYRAVGGVLSNGVTYNAKLTSGLTFNGNLLAADVPEGTPANTLTMGFTGLSTKTNGGAGAASVAFNHSFAGASSGSATPETHENITVTPGTTYQIEVAAGGSISLQYQALAGL